jgi:hypothetical protein
VVEIGELIPFDEFLDRRLATVTGGGPDCCATATPANMNQAGRT